MNAWFRYLIELAIAIGVSKPMKGVGVFILSAMWTLGVCALAEGLLLLLGPQT